jgi:hypothetical protein
MKKFKMVETWFYVPMLNFSRPKGQEDCASVAFAQFSMKENLGSNAPSPTCCTKNIISHPKTNKDFIEENYRDKKKKIPVHFRAQVRKPTIPSHLYVTNCDI